MSNDPTKAINKVERTFGRRRVSKHNKNYYSRTGQYSNYNRATKQMDKFFEEKGQGPKLGLDAKGRRALEKAKHKERVTKLRDKLKEVQATNKDIKAKMRDLKKSTKQPKKKNSKTQTKEQSTQPEPHQLTMEEIAELQRQKEYRRIINMTPAQETEITAQMTKEEKLKWERYKEGVLKGLPLRDLEHPLKGKERQNEITPSLC